MKRTVDPWRQVISATGLVKTFGRTRALDGLDLTVEAGEVHGFLGPNGSGKSTTIRILLGLLRADAGLACLLDGDPWRDIASLRRRLAYVPGDVTLWPNLSGGEVIDLLGRLRGGLNERRRAELLERFELDPPKGPRVFKGQLAEGRPGGRAGLRCRSAHSGRTDVRPGPAHRGGLPRVHGRRASPASAGGCSASPQRRRASSGRLRSCSPADATWAPAASNPSGPARAGALLRTPLALAWRLQRATLLAWAAGLSVYGTAIGGVADSITDLVEGSRGTRDLLTKLGGQKALIDAFLATEMGILGLVAAIYAVAAVLRLRAEESALRAEPILATPVGRIRWALSHVVFAVAGSAAVLVPAGLAAGLTHGLRAHELGRQVPRVLGGALVQLPAVWAIAAVAVVLFGFAPRMVPASWGVLGVWLLLGRLGPVLKLPQWVMDVSPFTHVPKVPGSPLSTTPLVVLTLVAGLLGLLGLLGFRRRDIG